MKSTLKDVFEFKLVIVFFWHLQLQYVKKIVGFSSNSSHSKFKFFAKHLNRKIFYYFIFAANTPVCNVC